MEDAISKMMGKPKVAPAQNLGREPRNQEPRLSPICIPGQRLSAAPSHAVRKRGGSAAGAAAGAPWNENKVYTQFDPWCAVRRKCWRKVYTKDAKPQNGLLTGTVIGSRESLHNRSKQ